MIVSQDGDGESADSAALSNEPKILGNDPATGRTVSLRRGPYGPYVQIDPEPKAAEPVSTEPKPKRKKGEKAPPAEKPKRQGLPKGLAPADVTLEAALKLLELPRDVGLHPQTGKMIKGGIGRFGPFLLHEAVYSSIPKDDDVLTIGINRAVVVIAEAAERRAKRIAEGKAPRRAPAKKVPAKKGAKAKEDAAEAPAQKAAPKKKAPAKKAPAKKAAKAAKGDE